MGWLYDSLGFITEPNSLPIVGIPYGNLYVVNSFDMLDTAAQDILKGNHNVAYFLYLDLPSNLLVYDENCQLKPSSKWISLRNLPWGKDSNQTKKLDAYADQSICLYGKLQSFISKLNTAGVEKDTVVLIHGLSSPLGLHKNPGSNVIAGFKNNNLVEAAVRDSKSKEFVVNYSVCNPVGIIKQYLLKKGPCQEFSGLNLDEAAKGEIKSNLSLQFGNDQIKESLKTFVDWYNNWEAKTQPIANDKKNLIPLEETEKLKAEPVQEPAKPIEPAKTPEAKAPAKAPLTPPAKAPLKAPLAPPAK